MIEELKRKIKDIISRSRVPEDPVHSENTLKWLLHFEPKADDALIISALGHDIERAMEDIKVKREEYPDYLSFKDAHARNSALVLKKIMEDMKMDKNLIQEVFNLVSLHEIGGNPRADLLKDADSISFFDVNLPLFYEREGKEKTLQRAIYGYNKISPPRRSLVRKISYKNSILNDLIKEAFSKADHFMSKQRYC